MKCIITGCCLIDATDGWAVWGDLWEVADTYVFNACLPAETEAAWQKNPIIPAHLKSLTIHAGARYFERRGVIVVSLIDATLNKVAEEYIK